MSDHLSESSSSHAGATGSAASLLSSGGVCVSDDVTALTGGTVRLSSRDVMVTSISSSSLSVVFAGVVRPFCSGRLSSI